MFTDTHTQTLSIYTSLSLSSLTCSHSHKHSFSVYLFLSCSVHLSHRHTRSKNFLSLFAFDGQCQCFPVLPRTLYVSLSLSPTHTHTPSNSFYRLIPIDTTPHVRDFLRQGVNPISEKETSAKLTRQWERWQLIERSRVRNQSMREKRNQVFCSPSHRRRRWLAQSAGY